MCLLLFKFKNIHFIKINNIADLGSELDGNNNNFSMKYTLRELKKDLSNF